jgi:lysozyme family protein
MSRAASLHPIAPSIITPTVTDNIQEDIMPLEPAFTGIIDQTLAFEGDDTITHDPDDSGGITKYGIAQASHPGLDVASLTRDQAKQLYYSEYWRKLRCHELPAPLSQAVFDLGVNAGPQRAVMALQIVLNLLGEDLSVDGWIGQKTIEAAMRSDSDEAAHLLQAVRGGYYLGLVAAKPKRKKYFTGWLNRVFGLTRFLGLCK